MYKTIKEVDKFANKTTIKMNKEYRLSRSVGNLGGHGAKLQIRYVSIPETEKIIIDYHYNNSYDYLYLDNGKLIIRLNDSENISLDFICKGKRERSVYEDNNGNVDYEYYEDNYVEIDKETLRKICDAESVEIQVSGGNTKEYSTDKANGFIDYCRTFYNELYNETAYELTHKDNNTSQNKKIAIIVLIVIIVAIIILTNL